MESPIDLEGSIAGEAVAKLEPEHVLADIDEGFFAEPPQGHYWLEHLIRTLARVALAPSERGGRKARSTWEIYGAYGGATERPQIQGQGHSSVPAVYAVDQTSGYGMFHTTHPDAGTRLLRWALQKRPPHKLLTNYSASETVIRAVESDFPITRDHRELFLTLSPGMLEVEPDWNYRLARTEDISRLQEFNDIYNRERATNWTRDWHLAVANRLVYVRERQGVISSCLIKGALMPPRISFGGTFTFPEFRGQGEATMLIANFCAEMALSNLEVCLIVDDDNVPALKVYSKVGFVPMGLYRTTYFRT